MILTDNPVHTLFLIQQADIHHVTFVFGDERKYLRFCQEHKISDVLFTYEGNARLFYEMTANGISTSRNVLDFDRAAKGRQFNRNEPR
jgi:hypothetical protein